MQTSDVATGRINHPVTKQVIVVRTDLKMGTGKLAAQVAHASTLLVEAIRDSIANDHGLRPVPQMYLWYDEWRRGIYRKIVLAVDSEDALENVFELAVQNELPAVKVYDLGLTELAPNTLTCIGIGPAPANIIDNVTGKLKLL